MTLLDRNNLNLYTIGVAVEFASTKSNKKFPAGFVGFIINTHADSPKYAMDIALSSVSAFLSTQEIPYESLNAADLTP